MELIIAFVLIIGAYNLIVEISKTSRRKK